MKTKISYLAFILLISSTSFGQVIYKMSANPVPPPNNTFEGLVGSIGTSNATIIIDIPITLASTTTTVGRNIALEFYKGNTITIGNGQTLTLNCSIKAEIFQIFNCTGNGKTDGIPLITECYPHWWQPESLYLYGSWSDAIQKAVDFHPRVYLPSRKTLSAYNIDKSIDIDLGKQNVNYYIYGDGGGSYLETGNYPNFNGFVFKCINTPDDGYNNGLTFENLSFFCKNGIEVKGGDSTPFANRKRAILNVKINNCKFKENSNGTNSGIAINFRKVFDSEISNNNIQGFGIGIKFEGVDISSIRSNRIQSFYKYAILDESFTDVENIGSQNSIFHNDLLGYKGPNNQNAFIKTTSNHVIIRDNYLENVSTDQKLWAFIDCSLKDLPLNSGLGTINHGSTHIDITGNRCDSSNTTTNFIYYINENFKSLNLLEIPTYNFSPDMQAPSTFAKMVPPSGSGNYTAIEVNRIPIKVDGKNDIDKLINMKNCFSFKNWENFSTSSVFTNNSNGDIIIDPTTISRISDTSGNCIPLTFNPRSFTLGPSGTPNCPNNSPSIFINFHQNTDFPGEFSDVFNNMVIKLKVRNLPISGSTEIIGDLYLRIDELNSGTWTTKYTNSSIDIISGTGPTIGAYSIIKIGIPATVIFNASKRYRLAISSISNYVKEFKEIIFENSVTVVTDSSAKQASAANPLIKEVVESEVPREETIQTLTVKVDNPVTASPNPVQSNLTIDIKKGDIVKSIEIYTQTGAFIGDYTNKVNNNIIDISSLPSATYVVKVVSIANTSQIIIKE